MNKNQFHLILSLFFIFIASCNDKDNGYIAQEELPADAIAFLEEYLPENSFITAHKNDVDGNQYLFEVTLSGNVFVSFDTNGHWRYIQSDRGLPETLKPLLSEGAQKGLKENYGNAKITALSKEGDEEVSIALNNHKKFKDIEAHEGDVLAEILELDGEGQDAMPDKIKIFINQYLPNGVEDEFFHAMLKFSGFRGSIYRLLLADRSFVDFYEDGDWFYMKNQRTVKTIQNLLIGAVPENILQALTKEQSDAIASLETICRYNYNKIYGFEIGNHKFIAVSSDSKIIAPPLDKAKEYIKRGFNPDKELQYEIRSNTSAPYFLRYAFIVTGQGTIRLATDVKGNMKVISAGPITSSGEGVVPLPQAILEMLPNAKEIMSYLEENYPGKDVLNIWHAYSVNREDVPEEISVMILIPNNLKTVVFDSKTGDFIEEYNAIRS